MMNSESVKSIELLAPARNCEYGKVAINHGADAVYIGAPQFSARKAASNSIADITKLTRYAHLFRCKVYTAFNTILYDSEIDSAREIINQLYNCGIDGLIIQDMGILELDIPPLPLIASTQTHNSTAEKVVFLEKAGFKRVILARELSLTEIEKIKISSTVELEFFVHGALCVSFSGQCYMSETVCKRSGNRGICAQPCRSSYNLIDAENNIIVKNKHLLSLKDLNLSSHLGELLNAGITSFKIEGRLKDLGYVKNVTSLYRLKLDEILEGKSNLRKSSAGRVTHFFMPDIEKSFNRGFTQYFINGRREKTGSYYTQKSTGKRIGYITSAGNNWITTDNDSITNGDGLCFFDSDTELHGTLVKKVSGNKIFLNSTEAMMVGTELFRNHDHKFEKMLQGKSAERKVQIKFLWKETQYGFSLSVSDENGITAESELICNKTIASNEELAMENLRKQLLKCGDTIFEPAEINIKTSVPYFVQAQLINTTRRDVLVKLEINRFQSYHPAESGRKQNYPEFFQSELDFKANVSNRIASQFYEKCGIKNIEPAFELTKNLKNKVIMTTKHCIRYQLDACPIYQKPLKQLKEPLFLRDNHYTYKLEFRCNECVMDVKFIG